MLFTTYKKKRKAPTNKISKYVWAVVLPYLCEHRLGERTIHEELDDIAAVDEAVIVSVRVLENFFIFLSVSHWYNPVHRRLETTEDIVWYEMMNTAFSIQQTNTQFFFGADRCTSRNKRNLWICTMKWLKQISKNKPPPPKKNTVLS